MSVAPDRSAFRPTWLAMLGCYGLLLLPTLWPLLGPGAPLERIAGTVVASTVVGLIGWGCLRREGASADEVGLGRRQWRRGLALAAVWWLVVTLIDWLGAVIAPALGAELPPLQPLAWSWLTVADWARAWIFVAIGEEIAFRAYLHNKVVASAGNRWLGAALAALLFGWWHVPGGLIAGRPIVSALIGNAALGAVTLVLFHLPYEWTGLLPLLIVFHGFNDFPLVLTMRTPNAVGIAAAYLLYAVAVWWAWRHARIEPQAIRR